MVASSSLWCRSLPLTGGVAYSVENFLDKNRDLLQPDIQSFMAGSSRSCRTPYGESLLRAFRWERPMENLDCGCEVNKCSAAGSKNALVKILFPPPAPKKGRAVRGLPQHALPSTNSARIISVCGAMRSVGGEWP